MVNGDRMMTARQVNNVIIWTWSTCIILVLESKIIIVIKATSLIPVFKDKFLEMKTSSGQTDRYHNSNKTFSSWTWLNVKLSTF